MKQKNSPAQILKDKKDKLDWQNFNFLENLLVFCTVPGRSVPKESGVHFRITLDSLNKSLCILFQIDRNKKKNDPLIRDQKAKRPDYMSLYIDSQSCICTIIEMKGKNHNSLENGIEQILKLKEILQTEISNHLPTKLKVKYQGILLTPHNSQPPLKKIAEIASKGFIILPIQYDHKAELYPYVSKPNKITDKYDHQEISESTALLIEEVLTKRALPKRISDDYYSSNFLVGNDREGIYINYLLPNDTGYITLLSNTKYTEINIRENEYKEKIKDESELLNLINTLTIRFLNRQISESDN